jgi:hypothetical protein
MADREVVPDGVRITPDGLPAAGGAGRARVRGPGPGLAVVSLLSGLAYLAACRSPAVTYIMRYDDRGAPVTDTVRGIQALLFGWLPPFTLAWSANLLLAVGWVLTLFRRTRAVAAVLGVLAAAAGATTLAFGPPITGLHLGYYLWQTSLTTFAVGTCGIFLAEALTPRADVRAAPRERGRDEAG